MVVDTSAVLAIFQREPECAGFARAISEAPGSQLSAVNYVECATVIQGRYGAKGEAWFDNFLSDSRIEIAPVDPAIADRARRAYAVFGKGRHKANLNLGDVFAYALAKNLDAPLLYKGNDFSHTDVVSAI